AHAPAKIGQYINIRQLNSLAVIVHQVEPVPAPGDIASDHADVRILDRDALGFAVAWNISHRNGSVLVQDGRDNTHGSLNLMFAGFDSAQVGQSGDQTNGPVAAHSEVTDIIKEDDARHARFIGG